jgi:hypothetical protein
MSIFEIKSGETVHCVELNSGKKLTGHFKFDQKGIHAYIYSYENWFFLKTEPIVLLTEKNEIVSLHSVISGPSSNISRLIDPIRIVYRQDITSNIAVIGHDQWATTDKIKRVSFTVKHTEGLLRHQAKTESLSRRHPFNEDDFSLYSEPTGNMMVRADYNVTYSSEFDFPTNIWPRFELEFNEGETLYSYVHYASCYVQFLSFSLGVRLKPSDIRISRNSREEMIMMVGKQSYSGDHKVKYVWPEVEIDTRNNWIGGSLVCAADDEELFVLRQCVVSWIGRNTEWANAYALMMTSLTSRGEISATRLIAACKWFEEIPLTKPENAIAEEDINEIATVAAEKASELGYTSAIFRRVAGSLKAIRTESHEHRFSRLVRLVRQRFGYSILPENVVLHLHRAIEFRGRAAHGHFNPADRAERRAFSKAIHAMEAFCYLLTALELPIHEAGLKRVQHNPVIRDYLDAYE